MQQSFSNSDSVSLNSNLVEAAIHTALVEYFVACRQRVQPFIKNHFRYPGAWDTNKSALGWDLLRAPFNLFWAPFYVLAQLLAWLCGKFRWWRGQKLLRRVPGGFNTSVQTKVAKLIASELLLHGVDSPNNLKHCILQALDDLVEPDRTNQDMVDQLEPVIEQALSQYGLTRTASADITNSLLSTLVGAFAFQKFTPGGFAIGLLLASWLAQRSAIENFFFGEFFGEIYFSWFPADPSAGLSLAATALVLACLAVFASFSGLITDPIQSWTGIHSYRLKKLLKHLQQDFMRRNDSTFSPKDPYVARILEILDAAKSQLL